MTKASEQFTPSAARVLGRGEMAGRKMPAGTPALPGANRADPKNMGFRAIRNGPDPLFSMV